MRFNIQKNAAAPGRYIMCLKNPQGILQNSLALGFLVLLVCSVPPGLGAEERPKTTSNPDDKNRQIVHLLNRVTFGPRPGDVEYVKQWGIDKYLSAQLHPESIPENPNVEATVSRTAVLNENPVELFQQYGPESFKNNNGENMMIRVFNRNNKGGQTDDKTEQQKAKGEAYRNIYRTAAAAKLMRAVDSNRQLQEVMTEFWFNHFNISVDKGLDHIWIGSYEQEAIRPYALGRFRDLLGATCHHAAMLFYLDNWQNTAPDAAGARGRFKGLNENYARELMELHTLGVDGGYSQQDVIELARILTGLGLPERGRQGRKEGDAGAANVAFGSYFNPSRHDQGDKRLLGYRIRGSGEEEIEQALDLLARHPSTAHHISYQLAQYFVADTPPKALVDRLAARFSKTDGNIRAVLTELFRSPEFWDIRYENSKYKNPFRFVVSALRATNAEPRSYLPIIQFLQLQGMPLYKCLTPDGYKNTQDAWLNPDALMRRVNFATALSAGKLPGADGQAVEYRQLGATLGESFNSKTVTAVMSAPDQLRSALILGSPDFMRY